MSPNVYAGPYLDRDSSGRSDAVRLSQWQADPAARWVLLQGLNPLIRHGDAPSAVLAEQRPDGLAGTEPIFLGHFRGHPVFAVETALETVDTAGTACAFLDLRSVGGQLPADEAGLLAYARALLYWRSRHRYCGSCGAPTQPTDGGHVMRCSRDGCALPCFPRIDPAIIVLVTDGDRALLGRQASWPAGRYSTIAGFVEPGESLEDAVVREVLEETGVVADGARYQSSQPWPFPSSLMLGFTARAVTTAIQCPDGELEDARFFSAAEIASGAARMPPSTSISYRLINEWYRSCTGENLAAGQPLPVR